MPPGAGAACPQHPTHGGRLSSRWETAGHQGVGARRRGIPPLPPSFRLPRRLRGTGRRALFGCHPLFSCPLPWRDREEGLRSRLPPGHGGRGAGHLSRDASTEHTPCRGRTRPEEPGHRSAGIWGQRGAAAWRGFPRGGRSPPEWGPASASGPCPRPGTRDNVSLVLSCSLSWCGRSACPGEGSSFYGSGQTPSWRIHSAELGLHPSAQPGSPAGGIPLSPRRLAPHS
jgi:hypothetical protein